MFNLFFSAVSALSAVNAGLAHEKGVPAALFEALGRSLGSLSRPAQKTEAQESKPEEVVEERAEKS